VEDDDMAKLVLEDLHEQGYTPLFFSVDRPPFFSPRCVPS
jgi:hypothetical protein